MATLVAWLFFIAFAVKLPVFPFHTWFIDAQAEASAPVALILGGVLVKLGGYGLIRVDVGEFQTALHNFAGAVVVIAVVTVLWIFAALAAIGFPGLAGFVGQLLIVVGAYPSHRIATPLALVGVLVVAGAMMVTVRRIFFGAISERHGRIRDLGTLELATTIGL